MSERTCETCQSYSKSRSWWCERFNFTVPAITGFGCNQHMPKPPGKRERICKLLADRGYAAGGYMKPDRLRMIEDLADRILEIVKD